MGNCACDSYELSQSNSVNNLFSGKKKRIIAKKKKKSSSNRKVFPAKMRLFLTTF